MISAIRVVIHGRVEGIGYRAWAVATAPQLGVAGWVSNRTDGTVEAVFRGEESMIAEMFEACKVGPPAAHVERIESFTWKEDVGGLFAARPTV